MKDRYQVLIDSQKHWDLDHPVMAKNNSDTLHLWSLLLGEVKELGDEVLEAESIKEETGMNWNNLREVCPQVVDTIAKELDDVFLFVLQMYSIIGVDLFQSVMDKRAYNMSRYTSGMFSNGRTYEQARDESRDWVKKTQFKSQFYASQDIPIFS